MPWTRLIVQRYSQLRCNPENAFWNILPIHIGKSCKVWVSLALACHLYVAASVEVCICVGVAGHLLFVYKKEKSKVLIGDAVAYVTYHE